MVKESTPENEQSGLSKAATYLSTGIWQVQVSRLPLLQALWIKPLRILLLSFRSFFKDDCILRSSALTLYSVLSIVPVLALAFGVGRGFGFDRILKERLIEEFYGQKEALVKIFQFAESMLEETKGGIVAGIGIVVLIWAVIMVSSNIERSFNHIWKVENPRSLLRKFSDYLSFIIICPLLMIMYGSATVYITSRVTTAAQEVELIGFFSQFLFFGLNLLPYMLIWLLFTFTYLLMPNTTVRLIPGIIAGIVASTIFQLTQGAYINFQVIVSKYNAIYGSFAALPLFLIWMQVSWLIVLFGAELSYAFQNSSRYEFEGDLASISQGHKKLIALKIAHMIVKTFARGLNPLSATQIIDKLKLPHHLVQTILNEMVVAEVLSLTPAKKGDGYAYLPSCDVQFYTINSVLKALDQNGSANIPASEYGDDQNIKDAVKMFAEAVDNLPSNRQLSDI